MLHCDGIRQGLVKMRSRQNYYYHQKTPSMQKEYRRACATRLASGRCFAKALKDLEAAGSDFLLSTTLPAMRERISSRSSGLTVPARGKMGKTIRCSFCAGLLLGAVVATNSKMPWGILAKEQVRSSFSVWLFAFWLFFSRCLANICCCAQKTQNTSGLVRAWLAAACVRSRPPIRQCQCQVKATSD